MTDYGPGEKEKTPRHKDSQDKIDEMFDTMGKDANALSDAMKSIAASVATPSANVPESPTKKKLRNYKELSESIRALIQERKDLVSAGLNTMTWMISSSFSRRRGACSTKLEHLVPTWDQH